MQPDRIEVPLIPECSSCIVHSLGTMIPLLTGDKDKQFELYSLAFKRVSEGYQAKTRPHALSLELYRELYAMMGVDDPYREIKKKSINAAKRVLPAVEKAVNSYAGFERLRAAVAASVVGNLIDYNTAAYEPNLDRLEEDFRSVQSGGFRPDHTQHMWRSLSGKRGSLLFLADNAGETLFDTVLVKIFRDQGWDCTFVVKGQAMINDATMEDIKGTEITKVARVISSGARAHGVPKRYVSDEFLDAVRRTDMVISKGQANIETFPSIQDETGVETYYVTRAKCPHIAGSISVPVGSNAVMRRPAPD